VFSIPEQNDNSSFMRKENQMLGYSEDRMFWF